MIQLYQGDCLEVMRTLPDGCVDSVVTDPPYGLKFMGKHWDHDVPSAEVWTEVLRVLKPGGHLLAFAGTRTQHRMTCAIEDAGFEIRDMIAWVYGSGFPKSHNVGKSIDREAGAEREVVGKVAAGSAPLKRGHVGASGGGLSVGTERSPEYDITEPATEAARQWQGWGTALKPALEPITMARKPFASTVAANVLAHGTGALNIDGCRVETNETITATRNIALGSSSSGIYGTANTPGVYEQQPGGRWPANLIHDGGDEVMQAFPQAPGQQADESRTAPSSKTSNVYGAMARTGEQSQDDPNDGVVGFKMKPGARRLDTGSAARFFYCAKASKKDRGDNNHPTVKPTDLMRYLCRLVTPAGGLILDPFMGSGSTGRGAVLEAFDFIGIEREGPYFQIAQDRINAAMPVPEWLK